MEWTFLISPIVSALIAVFGAYAATKRGVEERERKYADSIARLETKLDMLSDRVDKHNNLIERTYKLESDVEHLQSDVHDIKIGGTE